MSHRLKITIAYDGQPWKGWQSQKRDDTVQDQLEAALHRILGHHVGIMGSGRTDTGVHARGQVAHLDLEEAKMPAPIWCKALNANLPPSIRVLKAEFVPKEFHARFSALGKIYEYRIWNHRYHSPFEAGRSWHLYGDLDLSLLRKCCERLKGSHNFARLSANRGETSEVERRSNPEALTRRIDQIDLFRDGDLIKLVFHGEGFLYKMVRLMTGSMLQVARGRASLEWLESLIQHPEGEKSNHCAPAEGLYLCQVIYPELPIPIASNEKTD